MEKEVNSCSRLRRSASETNLLWRRKKVNGEALAQLNGAADISGRRHSFKVHLRELLICEVREI